MRINIVGMGCVPYHEIDSTDAMETAVNFLEKGIENKMYVSAD